MPINERSTKQEVIDAVEQDGRELVHASEELKNDRETVLAAVTRHGDAFKYASSECHS